MKEHVANVSWSNVHTLGRGVVMNLFLNAADDVFADVC